MNHEADGSLADEVMEWLSFDDGEPVAALYGTLRWHVLGPSIDVGELLETLADLERRGLVAAWQESESGTRHQPTADERESDRRAYTEWLPTAEFDELTIDTVGLWYRLTAEGREELRKLTGDNGEPKALWSWEEYASDQSFVVYADSECSAQEAVRDWSSSHPDLEWIPESKVATPQLVHVLRNGVVIANGVKIAYQYRHRASQDR